MFCFGEKSLLNLNDCHVDIKEIMLLAISFSDVDFGISEGYRSIERQKVLFDEGRSKIDGVNNLSKHNHYPSLAVDIYVYHKDDNTRIKIAYDKVHLAYIAGIVRSCCEYLKKEKKITHSIRWGGNFNMNNQLIEQNFIDMPHFELV